MNLKKPRTSQQKYETIIDDYGDEQQVSFLKSLYLMF